MGRPFSAFTTAGYGQIGTSPTRTGNQAVGLSLGSAYQWHFSALSTTDQNAEIARMQAAGVTWIRMDVAWDGVENTRGTYDWSYPALTAGPMVAAGINVLMILLRAPSWALALGNNPAVPDDPYPTISPTDFAAFCGAAAAHFGPLGVSAYEIWNEPNLDSGAAGSRLGLGYLSPVGYASLATAAYTAIHAGYVPKPGGAPTPTVVGGALAGWARLDWSPSPRTASWAAVPAGATSAVVTCATASQADLYKVVTGSSVSVSPSGNAGSWPAGSYVSTVNTNAGYVVSPPEWMSSFPAVNASSAFPTGVGNGIFGVASGYPPDVFLTQAYAAAQGPMFDALSLHPYVWQVDGFRNVDAGSWAMVPELRQIMVAHGDGAKPLWFTELGAPTGQVIGSWPAAAAGAGKLVIQGSANAEDVGCLVGVQGIALHSYVASVSTGSSWTVLPPTGLTVADKLTPGAAVSTLNVSLPSTVPAVTVPSGTTLTVWFGDGNSYSGDGGNCYALPPMTVTTTASATVAPGSTTALAIGRVTVPPILHGIVSAYPSGGLIQCATSLGQTWGSAVTAATRSAVNLLLPGVLATWSLPSASQSPRNISSEEEQALVIASSFQAVVSQPWPYVGPMFVFCWSDIGLGGNAGAFGLTRVDGSAKPALFALTAIAQSGGAAPGIGLPGYVGDGS